MSLHNSSTVKSVELVKSPPSIPIVDDLDDEQAQSRAKRQQLKQSCIQHYIGLYCSQSMIFIICFLVGIGVSAATYGIHMQATFLWVAFCVLQSILFFVLILFIYLIFHITICILNKQGKTDITSRFELPKICPFTCQISCCLYLSIIAVWYTCIAAIVVTWHPYLAGPFEVTQPSNNDYRSEDISFRPWTQTTQWKGKLYKPQNVDELIEIINKTNMENDEIIANGGNPKIIRTIGSGHSWTPQFSDDVLISLDYFDDLYISINDSNGNYGNYSGNYNDTSVDNERPYVIVGGGAIIGDVEDALFDLGYVLWGFGAAQFQTMGGMMGHGVGNTFGYMAEYCTDMWLVDGNGIDRHISKDDNETLLQAARVNR